VSGFIGVDGVSVTMLLAALTLTVPGTVVLSEALTTSETLEPWTGFVKAAEIVALGAIPVAPFAGVVERMLGGV
jgi:hypothetical protein